MVSHCDDVAWTALEHGDLRSQRRRLVRGGATVGLSRYRIPASHRAMALHVHADEEEIFFVLEGSGLSWQGDAVHAIGAGDVLVHPASGAPHTVLAGHSAEEELFLVLDGDGVALLGEEELPVRAGSLLHRPPGTGVAHALRAGELGMTYLGYGTSIAHDAAYFPRSQKLSFRGLHFRVAPVDYWDGE